jgi:hypothetical protein
MSAELSVSSGLDPRFAEILQRLLSLKPFEYEDSVDRECPDLKRDQEGDHVSPIENHAGQECPIPRKSVAFVVAQYRPGLQLFTWVGGGKLGRNHRSSDPVRIGKSKKWVPHLSRSLRKSLP